jgi:membrane protein YqaA with SNARE-associated domain
MARCPPGAAATCIVWRPSRLIGQLTAAGTVPIVAPMHVIRNNPCMFSSVYPGLFLVAFGAATLLPLQSEAVLAGLLVLDEHPVWRLVAVATAGNVSGSVVNWALGRYIERWRHRRWFPVTDDQLQRAQRAYHRYGRWSLLLSWVPFVGDPLTVIAGVMREPLWSFVLIVLVAKAGRYIALAGITLGFLA